MRFRFALSIAAVLLCAGLAQADTVTWTWGDKAANPAGTWTDAANWGGTLPTASSTVVFPWIYPVTPQWTPGGSVVTINSAVSVDAVTVNTGDLAEYTFLGTGTLNVAHDFFIYDTWWANFQPVLNVGGKFYTDPTITDSRGIIVFGSGGYGYDTWGNIGYGYAGAVPTYTNGDTFTGGIVNYNGWFLDIGGNNTTFGGTLKAQSYLPGLAVFGYYNRGGTQNRGVTRIGGTGNTYLAGTTFDPEYGGVLQFSANQNFTGVIAITFNGGMLKLDGANTFPTYAGGFQVKSGILAITGNASLGADDSNGIVLGGSGTFGYLMGGTASTAGSYVTRPITLTGNGGVFDIASGFYNSHMYLATNITGPGTLIKTGDLALYLLDVGSGGASDYTGGTIVASGQLFVDPGRTLGTGNVSVPFGGRMWEQMTAPTGVGLSSVNNMAPGASLYLGHSTISRGALIMNGNFDPSFIDPTSTGTIFLNTDVSASFTSIGNCFLASYWNIHTYSGASLPTGTDGTYRIGGSGYWSDGGGWLQMVQIDGHPNVLTGDHPLLVWNGGAKLWQPNNYTGVTTVSHNNNPMEWNVAPLEAHLGPTDGTNYSSLGSPTGAVVLQQGGLLVSNDSAHATEDVAVAKGALTFEGQNWLFLNSTNHTGLDVTFSSIARVGTAVLEIGSYNSDVGIPDGTTGKAQRLFVTSGVPASNGMASAYYIHVTTTYEAGFGNHYDANFLNYDAAHGFTKIADAAMTALPASGGGGTELALSAGTALAGNVSVHALKTSNGAVTGAGTVTLGSGGLIAVNSTAAWLDNTASFQFGPAGAGEALIFTPSNPGWWTAGVKISGAITANGLTKSGIGNLWLTGSNPGLTGKVVVNGGYLIAGTAALGNASEVVINGGGFVSGLNSLGAMTPIEKTIAVGPMGGFLMGYATAVTSSIVDDPALGPSGTLTVQSYTSLQAVNTWTGGLIVNDCPVRMDANGTPGNGPIVILGPNGNLIDYCGLGWSTPARVSLMGASNATQLSFEYPVAANPVWSFGSLEGTGDIVDGGYISVPNGTLKVGTDNTSSDYFGRIYEDLATSFFAFTKVGAGTLTLWGDSSWHGATNVNGGTLRINGSLLKGTYAANGVNVNSGGTLDGKGTIDRSVTVYSGGNLNGSLMVNGTVTSRGGTVNMTGATINGAVILGVDTYPNGAATFVNSTINGLVRIGAPGSASTVTGAFTGVNVTINDPGSFVISNGAFIGTNVAVTMPTDSVLTIGGAAASHVGSISGTGNSFTGCYTNLVNGTITGSNTFTATGAYGFYINSGGAAPCSLSGNNTITTGPSAVLWMGYAGDPAANTVVSGGNTINSCVYMYSGTLSGPNTIHGNALGALVVQPNSYAVVSPHVGDTAGTLTVVGDVTLDHSTTLNFNLGAPGTVGGGINDLIDVTGNVSLDGTLNVNALTYFGQGTYTLLTYTGTLTNNLTLGSMPTGGYTYSFTSGTLHAGTVYELNLSVVMPFSPGDTNHDGKLDSLDIDAIYHNFNAAANSQWKVTTDGLVVGQQDVTYELRKYFLTNYGDANLDNATDFPDFQTLLDHWQASGSTIGWAQGDFNGDYSVDFLDFQKLLDYWNPGGWHYAPMATPEPASLTLLVLGGLALLRRKK